MSLDATFALPQGLQRGELVAVLLPRGGERNAQLRIAEVAEGNAVAVPIRKRAFGHAGPVPAGEHHVDCGALPADCFTIEAAEGKNDVSAGDAYLTIVGQGNATGRAELAYTIAAKDIADESVNVKPIGELVYTGTAFEPPVTVKDGEKALVEGTDYTVTYADNTNAGTATVTITGKGNYTGTLTATFAIREAEKEDEDEADESTTEALTPAQQAEALASGEAVDGTVTDRHGEAAGYVPSTEEVTDKETQEVLERTLVIAADPLLDEDGQPILRDGAPVYEQRNLNLSRGLLDALAELG